MACTWLLLLIQYLNVEPLILKVLNLDNLCLHCIHARYKLTRYGLRNHKNIANIVLFSIDELLFRYGSYTVYIAYYFKLNYNSLHTYTHHLPCRGMYLYKWCKINCNINAILLCMDWWLFFAKPVRKSIFNVTIELSNFT